MQRHLLLLVLTVLLGLNLPMKAQDLAIKTNALYWLTTTPNIGVEAAVADRWTVEVTGAYNPWTFKDDKKLRFWLVQPEAKYWFCEKFEGHFIGIHAHGAQFYSTLAHKRRDGYLAGGGISYGYDWIVSPHFNIEAELGLGYAHIWYKESECVPCIKGQVNKTTNYFGPTKAAISLSYLF